MKTVFQKLWILLILSFLVPPLGIYLLNKYQRHREKLLVLITSASSVLSFAAILFSVSVAVSHPPKSDAASVQPPQITTNEAYSTDTILSAVQSLVSHYEDATDCSVDVAVQPQDNRGEITIQLTGDLFQSLSSCQLAFNSLTSKIYSAFTSDNNKISSIEVNFISGDRLNYIISLHSAYLYSKETFPSHAVITNLISVTDATVPSAAEPSANFTPTQSQAAVSTPKQQLPAPPSSASSSGGTATNGSISLVSITSPIATGKIATVTVKGKPSTEYDIKVKYSSSVSSAKGLENKISDAGGAVSWSWRIGAKTKPGTFTVTVSGGGDTLVIPITIS